MSRPHPLEQAIRVWAADPENWVWQARPKEATYVPWSRNDLLPPYGDSTHERRLVPRAWLDNPESVIVESRPRGSTGLFVEILTEPMWNHELCEYRIKVKPSKEYAAVWEDENGKSYCGDWHKSKKVMHGYPKFTEAKGWLVREGGKWGFESNE